MKQKFLKLALGLTLILGSFNLQANTNTHNNESLNNVSISTFSDDPIIHYEVFTDADGNITEIYVLYRSGRWRQIL